MFAGKRLSRLRPSIHGRCAAKPKDINISVNYHVNMKIKTKVVKFTGKRKIVEIPKTVRDNFEIGEEVEISKTKEEE